MMDKIKGAAGTAKEKVDVMVDKAGEKMPPKVKQTYGKVSEKVEKVIPGKKDAATDEHEPDAEAADTEAADIVAPGAGLEAEQQTDIARETAATVEDAASAAAMKAEGTADT
jgi:hypothetical protein